MKFRFALYYRREDYNVFHSAPGYRPVWKYGLVQLNPNTRRAPGSDVGHATYRDYFRELEVR